MKWFSAFLVIFLNLILVPSQGTADISEDLQFIQSLRSRRLFRIAEYQCQLSLQRPGLSTSDKAELTIQFLETLNEHALYADIAGRSACWQQAQQLTSSFEKDHADSDWSLVVGLAGVKVLVEQGKILREEAELTLLATSSSSSPADEIMMPARTILRKAGEKLKTLREKIAESLRRLHKVPETEGLRLGEQQLLSLERQAQLWTALAAFELGRTYPAGSDDYLAMLNEAASNLRMLSELPLTHPLGFPARLYYADVRRLLGQKEEAWKILDNLNNEALSERQQQQLLAARLQWVTTFKEEQLANTLFQKAAGVEFASSPPLTYAMLEAAVWFWQAAMEKKDHSSEEWEAQIKKLVEILRQSGSTYWTHRGELLVARAASASTTASSTTLNLYVADNAYRAGRWQEALAAYDRVAQVAQKAGEEDVAFQCGWAAAAIAQEQSLHEEAWQRFRTLSREFPRHAKAPEAAFLAVVNLGRLVAKDQNKYLTTYETELRDYLNRFPLGEEAYLVRFRLAQLLEYQSRIQEAVGAYLDFLEQLPAESANGGSRTPDQDGHSNGQLPESTRQAVLEKVFLGLDRCLAVLFEGAAHDSSEEAHQVAQRLHTWSIANKTGTADQRYRLIAEERAIRLLLWEGRDLVLAEKILLTRFPDPDHFWKEFRTLGEDMSVKSQWITLWLEVMAQLGQEKEAQYWCEQLRNLEFDVRWEWATSVTGKLSRTKPERVQAVARWVVAAVPDFIEQYAAHSRDWRLEAGLKYARLLVMANLRDESLQWMRRLAQEFPENGEIQENLALLLAYADDDALRSESLQKFQEIARRTPEGSPRWFRAKYMTAWLLHNLGKTRDAWDVLSLLETLHPDLGGEPLRSKILSLKEQCQRHWTQSR
ncbi:tetratricopeptide repeat protein [Thermogutta sp.]|uniref:tetratricopeptide repeat protein n=1 Tax=Thermogutta sp. TaxID=1962930 RepID=UPI003C7DF524